VTTGCQYQKHNNMYGKIIDGNITTYRRLPVQFEDENGLHLNFRNVADPSAYGFYSVVTPSYDSISQRLGAIEFDSDNDVFTYSVSDIDYTTTYEVRDEEGEPTGETLPNYDIDAKKLDLIKSVKEEANRLLSPTDWYILRKAERDVDVPSKVIAERGSIITKAAEFETAINALTTYESLLRYSIVFFPREL
jgi:hypothetical protein